MDNNPHMSVDSRHNQFENEKFHLCQLVNQRKQSFEEHMLATQDKGIYRLALIDALNDIWFHKAIEECSITADTISAVEHMHNQLVGAVLSATKQAVTLPKLSHLRSISNFKENLIPD